MAGSCADLVPSLKHPVSPSFLILTEASLCETLKPSFSGLHDTGQKHYDFLSEVPLEIHTGL